MRYAHYLKLADGYFELAYAMMEEDMKWLIGQSEDLLREAEETDTDLEYEIEVHKSVMDIYLINPFWQTEESKDPSYVDGGESLVNLVIDQYVREDKEKVSDKQILLLPEKSLFTTHEVPTFPIPKQPESVQQIIANKILERKAKQLGTALV
jgi:hypothetical protein